MGFLGPSLVLAQCDFSRGEQSWESSQVVFFQKEDLFQS